MQFRILLIALLSPTLLFAQEDEMFKPASPESQAYHEYRLKTTTPPYGLSKVKALVANLKDDNPAITSQQYHALSLREKFTYHMIHAESYNQNCDIPPIIQEEQKKISGFLPEAFNEANWSTRQLDFLTGNRDSVMAIIKESAERSKRIGLNYKHALVEINAVEMIPYLISYFQRDRKDMDILTVLLLLMRKADYEPFKSSSSYTKLYGNEASFYNTLNYNKANEDLIVERATGLYKSK